MKPNLPFPFTIFSFDWWVKTAKPSQIELTDKEYALLSSYKKKNIKDYDGIPIVFLDAPRVAL